MRKSRFTEEQIIRVLKEHSAGASARYGGMEISGARKLKALEDGNRNLRGLVD